MELCKWGHIGQSKWRKLQLLSLRIFLLLLPLQVTCLQILHNTEGKKDAFFFLFPGEERYDLCDFCARGAQWPKSCTLEVLYLPTAGNKAEVVQKEIPFSRTYCNEVPFVRVAPGEMLCWGCRWGVFVLRWDVQHRILPIESCTECKPPGAEVDLSAEDAAVIPGCCSGHRKYYLKCAKSRRHASELWCVEVKMR